MAKTIQTTGDLRDYLANMMVGIKDGLIDYQDANAMVKMAQQINESFYSEIKVAKVRLDATGEKFGPRGGMTLGTVVEIPKKDDEKK